MRLVDIPPYSSQAWSSEREVEARGERLACPNCDHNEWYHPVGIPPETGAERKYRACKMCGFWQEADGTQAYRCWMTTHVCIQKLPDGAVCKYCGTWGPREWHAGCWRILRPAELGVTACDGCGVVLSPLHVVPWPVAAE